MERKKFKRLSKHFVKKKVSTEKKVIVILWYLLPSIFALSLLFNIIFIKQIKAFKTKLHKCEQREISK